MIKPGKIVIVGGSAAGPAAAAKAKRINPEAEVTIFEAGDFISTIAAFKAAHITGKKIFGKFMKMI